MESEIIQVISSVLVCGLLISIFESYNVMESEIIQVISSVLVCGLLISIFEIQVKNKRQT